MVEASMERGSGGSASAPAEQLRVMYGCWGASGAALLSNTSAAVDGISTIAHGHIPHSLRGHVGCQVDV